MLVPILIAVAAVIVLFLVIVAMQPSKFQITRSTVVSAPPEVIFPQVNDFHNWEAWSPWAKVDPGMKTTYEGAPAGTGAIHTWNGNNKAGEGRSTITESRPSDLIRIKLEFMRPFVSTNVVEFAFKPQGEQTIVSWTMTGERNFMAKTFCLFMNMDKMVGGEFEKGLAQMKMISEPTAGK